MPEAPRLEVVELDSVARLWSLSLRTGDPPTSLGPDTEGGGWASMALHESGVVWDDVVFLCRGGEREVHACVCSCLLIKRKP